jgi:hypothetical protein
MSFEDLYCAIAYLQILRARLPKFKTVEDSLYPDTMVRLLERLYECQPIVSPNSFPIDGTIDISKNLSINLLELNQRVAKPGANKAILAFMHSQVYQKAYYRDIALILKTMYQGYYVPAELGLKTPSGEPYVGTIANGDEPDRV